MSEKKEIVNVRLDSTSKTMLEEKATAAGLSVPDYLRKIINDTEAQNKPPEGAAIATLHPAAVENLVNVLATVITQSQPQSIAVTIPVQAAPERDYLRKISGSQPEELETLSAEEEEYLRNLKNTITTDVREGFLLSENCVHIPFGDSTALQVKTFKEMIAIREQMKSDKLLSFTKIFQSAIVESFMKDSKEMSDGTFKQIYGFEKRGFNEIFEVKNNSWW